MICLTLLAGYSSDEQVMEQGPRFLKSHFNDVDKKEFHIWHECAFILRFSQAFSSTLANSQTIKMPPSIAETTLPSLFIDLKNEEQKTLEGENGSTYRIHIITNGLLFILRSVPRINHK